MDGDWRTAKYSGLYGYDLRTGKWTMLQYVTNAPYAILIVKRSCYKGPFPRARLSFLHALVNTFQASECLSLNVWNLIYLLRPFNGFRTEPKEALHFRWPERRNISFRYVGV